MGPSTFAGVDADGVPVVVKTAVPGVATAGSLDREREALEVLGQLGRPALVAFAGAVDDGAIRAVATVRIDGPTLDEHLHHTGPLGGTAAARALAPVADALAAIHAAGWVHGDASPANVVLGAGGAVLVDLGAAHRIDDRSARSTGTPGFTAPEVLAGAPTSPASDVWSLAALVVVAATGRAATGRTPARSSIPLDPPDPAGRSVLWPILRRALSPDPADRPGAATVQAALATGGDAAAGNPQPAAAAVTRGIDPSRASAPTRDHGPRPRPDVDAVAVADREGVRPFGPTAIVALATAAALLTTFFGS